MIRQGHIDGKHAVVVLLNFIAGKVFVTFPRHMAILGQGAGWMVATVAAVAATFGFYITVLLLRRFPGRSIIDISCEVGGGVVGRLSGLAFFALFALITATVAREFGELVLGTILRHTPISIVVGALMGAGLYTAYLGLEAIARGAMLLFPFMVLGTLGIVLFDLRFVTLSGLAPWFGPGLPAILEHGLRASSNYAEILLLVVLAPYVRNRRELLPAGLASMGLSWLIMAGFTALAAAAFPIPVATRIVFPLFHLARLVSLGEFLQRTEALFVLLWLFSAGVKMSAGFYASALVLAETLDLPDYRPLLFPLAVLLFSVSFIFPSLVEAIEFDTLLLRIYAWIPAFALPAMLLALALVRRKGASAGAQG